MLSNYVAWPIYCLCGKHACNVPIISKVLFVVTLSSVERSKGRDSLTLLTGVFTETLQHTQQLRSWKVVVLCLLVAQQLAANIVAHGCINLVRESAEMHFFLLMQEPSLKCAVRGWYDPHILACSFALLGSVDLQV